MSNQALEHKIEVLDKKIDLLLNYVNEQRLRTQAIEDLVADLSIVGKDLYDTTIVTLGQKGYMEFLNESISIVDNVVTHFSTDDVRLLADNVVTILETVKSLTQPEMMQAITNAVQVFNAMEQEEVPSFSIFGAIREMNKPEMQRALGFALAFLRNISQNSFNKTN